jgi:hypothetical protein
MATLRSSKRNVLPDSAFALPSQRKYPIHDVAHAKAALARAADPSTAGAPATIRRAVLKKYPMLKKG